MGLRVAALMTVHNRSATTLACLESIQRQQAHAATVDTFVVDDGSTDGTVEAIARTFPDVMVLPGDGTLFWNGGMRKAFGKALLRAYDFYWWLNDDTRLDDNALRTLLLTYEQLRGEVSDDVIVVGTTRQPDTGLPSYGGVVRPSRLRPLRFSLVAPGSAPRECETMNGNCVLIPHVVAGHIGNLDPAYLQKMGDFDYGLRARAAGCSIWITPGTIGSCATHPPRRAVEGPLYQDLKRLSSTKELPIRAWATFSRRWSGPLWPLYFASPYLRRSTRQVLERLRRRSGNVT